MVLASEWLSATKDLKERMDVIVEQFIELLHEKVLVMLEFPL